MSTLIVGSGRRRALESLPYRHPAELSATRGRREVEMVDAFVAVCSNPNRFGVNALAHSTMTN